MNVTKFQQHTPASGPTVIKISCYGLEICSLGRIGLLSLKDTRNLLIEHAHKHGIMPSYFLNLDQI